MRWRLMRPIALVLVLVLGAASVSTAADQFVVIVNPSVAGSNIRRADLAAVFLKKAPRWGGGALAVPVDQSGTAAVRKAFSEAVIRQPVDQVVQYWQKLMFTSSPLRPPSVKASDAEVIVFVAKTSGAVGYVTPGAALPAGVKTLLLIH